MDGKQVMKIIDSIYRSAAAGKAVAP